MAPPANGPITGIHAYDQSLLAADGQERVHDARAQVARRIDRIAGGATERQADAPDEQRHRQRTQ